MADLDALQATLGYRFAAPALLAQALVHRSASDRQQASNERLEFLGDAALGLITARWLYQRYPSQGEGNLTIMRSALVRRETLAGWAAQFGLGDLLQMSRGVEQSAGRSSPRILASVFEALLGAVLLDADGGLTAVEAILLPLVEAADPEAALRGDPKGLLMQVAQNRYHVQPVYHLVATTGPGHALEFSVEVSVADLGVLGAGTARNKQQAEAVAAHAAISALEQIAPPPSPEVRDEIEQLASPYLPYAGRGKE